MGKKNAVNNAFRVRLDTFLACAGRIVGWIGALFWGVIGIVGLSEYLHGDAVQPVHRAMLFVCLILTGLHVWLILSSSGIRDLIRDFRLYSAMLAKDEEKSVLRLSQRIHLPLESVLQKLQKMCRRGYFNGYLDHQDQCLYFPDGTEQDRQVVYCPGCGARNALSRSVGTCRYCGAPLRAAPQNAQD